MRKLLPLLITHVAFIFSACTLQEPVATDATQVEQYRRMIDESAEQMERQSAVISAGEEILRRQEKLLTLQEEQAQRFNAILDKWESMIVPIEPND